MWVSRVIVMITPRLWHFVTLVIAVPKQDDQDDEGQHDDEQERDDHRHHDQAGLLVFRGGAVKRTLGRKEEQQLSNCHVIFWNAGSWELRWSLCGHAALSCLSPLWCPTVPTVDPMMLTDAQEASAARVICGGWWCNHVESRLRRGQPGWDTGPHPRQSQPQRVNYSAQTQTWTERHGKVFEGSGLRKFANNKWMNEWTTNASFYLNKCSNYSHWCFRQSDSWTWLGLD